LLEICIFDYFFVIDVLMLLHVFVIVFITIFIHGHVGVCATNAMRIFVKLSLIKHLLMQLLLKQLSLELLV
jgi:hypothetical protein